MSELILRHHKTFTTSFITDISLCLFWIKNRLFCGFVKQIFSQKHLRCLGYRLVFQPRGGVSWFERWCADGVGARVAGNGRGEEAAGDERAWLRGRLRTANGGENSRWG